MTALGQVGGGGVGTIPPPTTAILIDRSGGAKRSRVSLTSDPIDGSEGSSTTPTGALDEF